MLTDYFLLGAGGHSKVVYEAWSGACSVNIKVFDDDEIKHEYAFMDTIITAPINISSLPTQGHVAIGDNATRRRLSLRLATEGKVLLSIIHLQAMVSKFTEIGPGCFLAAGSIIAPDVVLGQSVVINHGSVIDHDCRVNEYSHIAPNVTLGGGVVIGSGCLVGSGAVVLPGVRVANDVTIGAGAVVAQDIIENNVVFCGVPAKLKALKIK